MLFFIQHIYFVCTFAAVVCNGATCTVSMVTSQVVLVFWTHFSLIFSRQLNNESLLQNHWELVCLVKLFWNIIACNGGDHECPCHKTPNFLTWIIYKDVTSTFFIIDHVRWFAHLLNLGLQFRPSGAVEMQKICHGLRRSLGLPRKVYIIICWAGTGRKAIPGTNLMDFDRPFSKGSAVTCCSSMRAQAATNVYINVDACVNWSVS